MKPMTKIRLRALFAPCLIAVAVVCCTWYMTMLNGNIATLEDKVDSLHVEIAQEESRTAALAVECSTLMYRNVSLSDELSATANALILTEAELVEALRASTPVTSRGVKRVPVNDVTAAIRATCPEYTWSDDANMNAAVWICDAESDSRVGIPCADPNSSAMGLGQLTLSNRTKYGVVNGDMMSEIHGMLSYIRDRYGSPVNAWAFWLIDEWY